MTFVNPQIQSMSPFFPGGIQKVNIFPSGSKIRFFFSVAGGIYISLLAETSEWYAEGTPAYNGVKGGWRAQSWWKK